MTHIKEELEMTTITLELGLVILIGLIVKENSHKIWEWMMEEDEQ